jgi:long-chain acyl-CoA synthetase
VQFRSPGMFVGYFNDQATAETLTADGYVKTGDAGFFDEKTRHLKIIDRAAMSVDGRRHDICAEVS